MKHRKLFALILATALLAVGVLPLTVSAAPMANNGSITISPPGILVLTAADFKAYKLYNVTRITEGNETPASGYQFGYEPVEAVNAFLATLTGPAYGVTYPITNPATAAEEFRFWLQDNFEESFDEAEIIALAKAMINAGALTPAMAKDAVQADTDVKFTGLDYGYYLVTGAGLPTEETLGAHSKNVISRGMLVNVPELTYQDGHAYDPKFVTGWTENAKRKLKADAPSIDKEVWHHTGVPFNGTDLPDATDWQKWTDVNIGDTVYFKHSSRVPNMTGYDSYTFIVHDVMSAGLTFDPASVKIEITDPAGAGTTIAPAFTLTNTAITTGPDAGGTAITITFTNFIQYLAKTGWDITITYSAMLNGNAVVGAPGNPNRVKLEYSNNPNDGGNGTGETPEDKVTVYTFDLEIFKYTGKLDKDYYALSGAEFELRAGGSTGKAVSVVPYTEDGYNYRLAMDPEPAAVPPSTTVLVSDANGKIKIKGLDAGEYALVETKAPIGYNLLPGWITTVIVHKDAAGAYEVKVDNTVVQVVNVLNQTGGQLPGTGGIGIYVILAVGGLMAILLAVAFVVYRRKKTLGLLNA